MGSGLFEFPDLIPIPLSHSSDIEAESVLIPAVSAPVEPALTGLIPNGEGDLSPRSSNQGVLRSSVYGRPNFIDEMYLLTTKCLNPLVLIGSSMSQ